MRRLWISSPLVLLVWFGFGAVAAAEPALKYNRDIRPILSENCFSCHGPDSASRKADLRLDQREAAIEAGALAPGEAEASELVRRILAEDPDEQMPPPSSHKKLTAEQKERLRQWVVQGAEYEPHWSFITPQRPALPAVKNEAWIRNPIDHFVLARLEAVGLQPAPEADRRTLARRLSLDLTGLPPDPKDVEAFVADHEPHAYERYVERLLNSPHWGEHRSRYWLDAARYADTHGIHFDNYREIWTYRDWVIRAFNENMPFDQFTIEQLAGDLLPNPTLEQRIATGFNRCNITTNEGGVIPEEYLVLYTRDRTETTAQVFMGLTAGCAVCHDHKFDPLSQREFYELAAYFNNTTQGAMDGNIPNTPPVMVVPQLEDRSRWDALQQELPQARQQLETRRQTARADFDAWVQAADRTQFAAQIPTDHLRLLALAQAGEPDSLEVTVDGQAEKIAVTGSPVSWEAGHVGDKALKLEPGSAIELPAVGDFEREQAFTCAVWVKLPPNVNSGAVVARMDDGNDFRGWDLWLEGGRVGSHIIHKWQEDAIKVVSQNPIDASKWNHLLISYDGSSRAAGVKVYVNGVLQGTNVTADALQNTIRTEVPLKIGQRHATSRIEGLVLQDLRLYDRALSEAEAQQLAQATRADWLLRKPADQRAEAETNELYDWWLTNLDDQYASLASQLRTLEQEESAVKQRGSIAHVMQEKDEPPTAYVLFRGEYDQRRDQVSASTPDVLPAMPGELPNNRLGLAHWLLHPDHPLTARVTVNRFWQQVFGTGIVRTAEDFGVTGELPTHPELLDWLAVEFRESEWDIKHLFRLMVNSSTYRQAALTTPEKLELDADNLLLSRGPRFRMDGEMVRDYALAASGLLVRKLGGPSVKPYQPEGVWEAVAMIGSNTRDYRADTGDKLYRRSLYTFWKRSAPPASMDIFNAPSREVCMLRRERTNTPLQALVTLNDVQFVEAARHLAEQALLDGGTSTDERLEFIARRLLARPLRSEELPVVQSSLSDLLGYYQQHPDDAQQLITVGESKPAAELAPGEMAGWTMLVNQMMNLDEVLNK